MVQQTYILAVDDEEFNLDLVDLAFMEHPDVTITRAYNGIEALKYLDEGGTCDVVLLDLAMPIMNGLETLRRLREDARYTQLPVIVVTANSEEKNRAFQVGANDFLGKPVDVDELRHRTLNYARISHYQNRLNEVVDARTRALQEALTLAKATEYEISSRLGKASEYRDLETGMHIKRMSHFSAKLGELAGLSPEEVELLLYASPLHDIGKVGIPDQILLKPGRFTPEEFEIMKLHAELGAQILADAEQFPVVEIGRIIAREHHEKFDGSGYPRGLRGNGIHLFARIVAIADVFDALTSKRVYKEAMPLEKALGIMKEGSGTHFDPHLLTLFLENLHQFLEIQEQFPDDDEHPSILQLIQNLGKE